MNKVQIQITDQQSFANCFAQTKRQIPVKMVEITSKDTTFTCASKILSIVSHIDTRPSDSNDLLINPEMLGFCLLTLLKCEIACR